MSKIKEIIELIFESEIGLEIEDNKPCTDQIAQILLTNNIPYTYGQENDLIKEIRFHVPFHKMVSLGKDIMPTFTLKHAIGMTDKKAGSIHVHFDTETLFIPSLRDMGVAGDCSTYPKISSIIDELDMYMKKNLEFRDRITKSSRAIRQTDDSYRDLVRAGSGGVRKYIASVSSKSYSATYNVDSGKPETLEVRLNEAYPLWIPLFLLRIYGFNINESMLLLNHACDRQHKYFRHSEICFEYCKEIYTSRTTHNTRLLKKLFSEFGDIPCVE